MHSVQDRGAWKDRHDRQPSAGMTPDDDDDASRARAAQETII